MALLWTYASLLGGNLPDSTGWGLTGNQDAAAVVIPYYFRRPGGVDLYRRPDTTSLYIRY